MTQTVSQADTDGQELARVQAFVAANLWRRVRAKALMAQKSSSEVLTEALEAWVEKAA